MYIECVWVICQKMAMVTQEEKWGASTIIILDFLILQNYLESLCQKSKRHIKF